MDSLEEKKEKADRFFLSLLRGRRKCGERKTAEQLHKLLLVKTLERQDVTPADEANSKNAGGYFEKHNMLCIP